MSSTTLSLEELRDVVLGRRATLARGEAFAKLASSGSPDREALLATVLANADERPSTRAGAAIALGRIPTPEAERALAEATREADPQVLDAVLHSLGRIGGPAALAVIDALDLPPDHRAVQAARFGAALICHRCGIEGHDLPHPGSERLLPASLADQEIEVTRPSAGESAEVLAGLRRQPYGIELDDRSMVQVRCLDRTNTICLNRVIADQGLPGPLLGRKLLAGLVALRSSETGEHSVSYLMLTTPRADARGVDILMPRCSGPLALAGIGRMSGARLGFALTALQRPGAVALRIEGAIDDGRLTLTTALHSASREPRLRPSYHRVP